MTGILNDETEFIVDSTMSKSDLTHEEPDTI